MRTFNGVVRVCAACNIDEGALAAGVFLDDVELKGLATGVLGVPHCFRSRGSGRDVETNSCVFPITNVVAEFKIGIFEEAIAQVEGIEGEVEDIDYIVVFRYGDYC